MTAPTVTGTWQVYALSGRTDGELAAAVDTAARRLAGGGVPPAPDTGGRHRLAVVARDAAEAGRLLADPDLGPGRVFRGDANRASHPVFIFPGVGEQRVGMARELYDEFAGFRRAIDECGTLLTPWLDVDLRDHLLAEAAPEPAGSDPLGRTLLAQPAVFTVGYAVATQLIEWGVTPTALAGYSIGEYVAATVAGVLTLPDALRLVANRATLIDGLPAGAMALVMVPQAELAEHLPADGPVCLAAVNGPRLCVVSGPTADIAELVAALTRSGIPSMRLPTRHAFHSTMMRPLDPPLRDVLRTVELRPPAIPFLSNVTGDWITPAEATAPDYWARHLSHPVHFADNVARIFDLPGALTVEAGAGQMLTSLANQHPGRASRTDVATSSPMTRLADQCGDAAGLLGVAALAWVRGADAALMTTGWSA